MVTAGSRGRAHVDADSDGFTDLFFGNAARLVRLAALLGDDDPEDVVQEAFCRVYAALSRLLRSEDVKVIAYLNKVVVNEVRSRHRRRRTARRDGHLFEVAEALDLADRHGERLAVTEALSRLPQRQRESLVLRYWLDLPLQEIAEVMGVRLGTVKSQISRGLAAMATGLGVDR